MVCNFHLIVTCHCCLGLDAISNLTQFRENPGTKLFHVPQSSLNFSKQVKLLIANPEIIHLLKWLVEKILLTLLLKKFQLIETEIVNIELTWMP